MSSNSCKICLKSSLELVSANETDSNNVKWSCKLIFCVPEVQWDEDCSICYPCTEQLDTACSFRNLCLQSNGSHMQFPNFRPLHNNTGNREMTNKHAEPKHTGACSDNQTCICTLCVQAGLQNNSSKQQLTYTCYICSKQFTTKAALTRHIVTHSLNCCKFCNQQFTTKTQLQLHIMQMHNEASESRERCRFCSRTFQSLLSLNQHIMQEHWTKDSSFNSEYFDKVEEPVINLKLEDLCSPLSLEYSQNSVSTVKADKCFGYYPLPEPDCSSIAPDSCDIPRKTNGTSDCDDNVYDSTGAKSELQEVVKAEVTSNVSGKQSRKNDFVCDQCQSVFMSSKKLISHAIRAHSFDPSLIKPFECDKCNSKFSTSSNLFQHKKYHVGQRTHICTFCGKGYITKSDLNTHEKQHLNKREYQCAGCPKTFNTNKDLRSHRLVVHTDPSLWNYVCTFCQKRFPIKSNLDQHIRRHTGEKRFGCHICEKRFVDKIVLQKHIKSHSNFRAFKCEHCAREYKDCKVLEVHLTKVHGIGNAKIPVRIKKYFCHVCPKSYFAKNKLTRHMFSHTGEKPFQCHICDKRFTDKSYVKQHLKATHNVFKLNDNK